MQEGIIFVHRPHLQRGKGLFLPHADIVGQIYNCLQVQLANQRKLTAYVPNFTEVDFFLIRSGSSFALFISQDRAGHLPTWGFDDKFPIVPVEGNKEVSTTSAIAQDISESRFAKGMFQQLGMTPGPAIFGTYPEGYSEEAKRGQSVVVDNCTILLLQWAENRRRLLEEARIFLSHKTVDKPLVQPVYDTLRLLGLNPWLDVIDARRGHPLARELDSGVQASAMAVFFITSSFGDGNFIAAEIDRALHKRITTPDFQLLPLVLTEHGGSADIVPASLGHLIWATVRDVEIVHAILRDLPKSLRDTVRFAVKR